MKEYTFDVTVSWIQCGIEADNNEEAIDKLKDLWEEEYGFRPKNTEISIIDSEDVDYEKSHK